MRRQAISRQRGGIYTFHIVFTIIAAIVAIVAALSTVSQSPSSAEKRALQPADYPAAARDACRQFLERSLRDPSSAEWIEQWNWRTVDHHDDTWTVLSHYRARNGFGGMNVEATMCTMLRIGNDWKLLNLVRAG